MSTSHPDPHLTHVHVSSVSTSNSHLTHVHISSTTTSPPSLHLFHISGPEESRGRQHSMLGVKPSTYSMEHLPWRCLLSPAQIPHSLPRGWEGKFCRGVLLRLIYIQPCIRVNFKCSRQVYGGLCKDDGGINPAHNPPWECWEELGFHPHTPKGFGRRKTLPKALGVVENS